MADAEACGGACPAFPVPVLPSSGSSGARQGQEHRLRLLGAGHRSQWMRVRLL